MSKKNSYLLGILLTIGIGTLLYYFYCCNCCCSKTNDSSVSNISTTVTKRNLMLQGKGVDYQCESNFNFLNNDFKSIVPISDSINIGIDKLKEALLSSKQQLTVTGYALSSEKNNSVFENLGLARANDVKNYLVSRGISSDHISIKGEIKDEFAKDETTTFGPVLFGFEDEKTDAVPVDYAALKDKFNANPLILYFNTGQTSIELSESDRKKVSEMTFYLDHVSGSKIDVVGHTDNVGDRLMNTSLGKERADFAKNYLVSNGILSEKINSTSKGPDMQIADNNSVEGKAKNRRVEVKIN